MVPLEALIRQVLANRETDYFPEDRTFRRRILNRPEAAEILVLLMQDESPEIASRAREMLCFFDTPAVHPLRAALVKKGAMWRAEIINIIWTIMCERSHKAKVTLLKEILPQLLPLLEDQEIISPEHQNRVEIEYRCRVCDEAYLLIREMGESGFDDCVFIGMDFEERDEEIESLRRSLQPPLVG